MGKPSAVDSKSLDTLDPARSSHTDEQPPYYSDDLLGEGSSSAGPSSEHVADTAPLLLDFDTAPPQPTSASKIPGAGGDDELPPYSISPEDHGEQPPPFSKYEPKKHSIRNGKVVSHDAHLNSDAEALYQWLLSESSLPPKPMLELEGTHRVTENVRENGKNVTRTNTVTDFHLTFDLSEFLVFAMVLAQGRSADGPNSGRCVIAVGPEVKRRRGTRMAKLGAADEEAVNARKTIRDWCDDYVRNPAYCKEFTLNKVVTGLDEQYIRKHLEMVIRSTNYRGNIRVTFPVSNRSVILAPDNWICHLRYSWARWIFYISFLWIITWPILWVVTKRWDVVDATYNTLPNIEKIWINRWNRVIGYMVRNRRQQHCITGPNLRWVECQDMDRRAREQSEVEAMGGAAAWIGGILRGTGQFSETIQGGWGADEW